MAEARPGTVSQNRFSWISKYRASLSFAGIIGACLFFALSLTPSLLPRTFVTQGLLSGCSAAIGFGVGHGLFWLWRFLELPLPGYRAARVLKLVISAGAAALTIYFLWLSSTWQDSVRELMKMDPMVASYAHRVVLIAVPVAVILIEIGRAFAWSVRFFSRRLDRVIPRRISAFVSLMLAAALFAVIGTGTLGRWSLQALDSIFLQLDALIDDDLAPPAGELFTGVPQSLVSWKQLGRQGRQFIASGPTQQDIAKFVGDGAMQPLRIYVGLGGAETAKERAELALAEMKRQGAFNRSVLVVATPTGTGWLDPAAVDSLEFLHRGDTAVVAMQYSYLQSYVSLFVEPGYAEVSARALFIAVYNHWTGLPKKARPRLYLHGLSLGSYGSEQSTDLYFILGDLIDGAVWSGPPFRNPKWVSLTRNRNPGSPAWLPEFRDSSMVRFTNQTNALNIDGAQWGPMRIVYIQYASDPITFFSTDSLFQRPDWLVGERGPDVSQELVWYPIVTALQVGFDMIRSTETKRGFGHMYSASSYIDAWLEVTEPAGWPDMDVERLKVHLSQGR